jgi:GABA permease
MHRYMVVANQTLGGEELVQVIRDRAAAGASEFWVVVPATEVHDLAGRSVPMTPMPVMGGILEVPGPPEEARKLAEDKLRTALQQLAAAGVKADGEVGDPDPMCAVRDALSRQEFDEIIVSTLPERFSRWLHQDLPQRLEHKFHLPVTHVETMTVYRH